MDLWSVDPLFLRESPLSSCLGNQCHCIVILGESPISENTTQHDVIQNIGAVLWPFLVIEETNYTQNYLKIIVIRHDRAEIHLIVLF
jgi:hypothetical protein